ncbi:MAG: transposase, partial [Thermotoga sp.]
MALTMREKKKIGLEYSRNYLKARKKEKGRILDNFTEITGYNRNYGSRVLRDRRHSKPTGIKRKKKEKYGEDVRRALERIWSICDCICGKRLKPF